MFLGPAAVGKTSLRHGLMNQELPDEPESTILANTCPVKYHWVKAGSSWTEVTEEELIHEEVCLFQSAQIATGCQEPSHVRDTSTHQAVDTHKSRVLSHLISTNFDRNANEELLFHLWDCGGQTWFMDVLPAFLTSQTVFLFVFDASKNLEEPISVIINDDGQQRDGGVIKIPVLSLLQKWMASIHDRFANIGEGGRFPDYPRIIVVGTHADQLAPGQPQDERERIKSEVIEKVKTATEAYSDMILDCLVVNNTTAGKDDLADKGFEEIRNIISTFVKEHEIPASWIHFGNILQLHIRKEKPVIPLKKGCSLAAQCFVPEEEVTSALLFYHDLGVFLFYPDIKGLESVVILEPQWLVDQFGKLLSSWKGKAEYGRMWNTLGQYGILVQPFYEAVLSGVQEYSITPESLVNLLEHFLLAASIVTTSLHSFRGQVKEYFIPLMLEHRLPDHALLSQSSALLHSSTPPQSSAPPQCSALRQSPAPPLSSTPPQSSTPPHSSTPPKSVAAPIHLTFITGYVPPGYFVQLATSLAAKPRVKVLFHAGIYRNQISMDIGVDRLTIIEHTETVELQFHRQAWIREPFKESCRSTLVLLSECFPEIHQLNQGAREQLAREQLAREQLAFPCPICARTASPHVPSSRAKFCFFTVEQRVSEHLCCGRGHYALPTRSQRYWLQPDPDEETNAETRPTADTPARNPGATVSTSGGDHDSSIVTAPGATLPNPTTQQSTNRLNDLGVTPSSTAVQPSNTMSPTLDDTPTLHQLVDMKGRDGKPLNVIEHIALKYDTFGISLLYDDNGVKIDVIKRNHIHEGTEAITQAILKRWLEDGGPTCTYQYLIECLRNSGLGALADEIFKQLHQADQGPQCCETKRR